MTTATQTRKMLWWGRLNNWIVRPWRRLVRRVTGA